MDGIELVFLGTGGGRFATITQKRRTGGIRLISNRLNIHIDPGPGALIYSLEAGLNPHPTAMIGYPWETRAEAQRTLDLARRLFKKGYADTLQATIVTPYPGTPLFREAEGKGWLKTKDWDRYDMRQPILKTAMSAEEIKGLVQGLYKSILTPQFIWRKIKEGLSDWDTFRAYLRYALKFFSKMIDFKPSSK